MWRIQTIDSEFRKRMYDVLDLYEEDYDPKKPIVCLDEIRLITDNLNIHNEKSFYEAFSEDEAKKIRNYSATNNQHQEP